MSVSHLRNKPSILERLEKDALPPLSLPLPPPPSPPLEIQKREEMRALKKGEKPHFGLPLSPPGSHPTKDRQGRTKHINASFCHVQTDGEDIS